MWLTKDPRSGVYRAYWRTPEGKQRSISTKQTVEAAAKQWAKDSKLAEIENLARASALTPQVISRMLTGGSLTVPAAIERWKHWALSVARQSSTTVQNSETALEAWCRDSGLSKRQLLSISSAELSEYINRHSDRKLSSAGQELSILRRFFEYFRNEGLTTANPAANLRVAHDTFSHTQKESHSAEPFTVKEVELLIEQTTGFWKVACILASQTGLRLGDIAKLEWASVKNNNFVVWTDKTNARVDHVLTTLLHETLDTVPKTDLTYCFPEQQLLASNPIKRAGLSVQFRRICDRLGLEGKSFHSFRHFYVTEKVKAGQPILEIAKAVGHASSETTSIYNHARPRL